MLRSVPADPGRRLFAVAPTVPPVQLARRELQREEGCDAAGLCGAAAHRPADACCTVLVWCRPCCEVPAWGKAATDAPGLAPTRELPGLSAQCPLLSPAAAPPPSDSESRLYSPREEEQTLLRPPTRSWSAPAAAGGATAAAAPAGAGRRLLTDTPSTLPPHALGQPWLLTKAGDCRCAPAASPLAALAPGCEVPRLLPTRCTLAACSCAGAGAAASARPVLPVLLLPRSARTAPADTAKLL